MILLGNETKKMALKTKKRNFLKKLCMSEPKKEKTKMISRDEKLSDL